MPLLLCYTKATCAHARLTQLNAHTTGPSQVMGRKRRERLYLRDAGLNEANTPRPVPDPESRYCQSQGGMGAFAVRLVVN